jgi:diguanylate cyclase (GGDEF)-like protein/PAS domain S-box-containing protein
MSVFDDSEIYRSILESLPTGLCVLDMQKRIVLWSDGAERITGHLRHDVIGHCCVGESLLHCNQPGCEWCNEDCPMARAIKTAHRADGVGFLHHKTGYQVPVHVRAVPVRDRHGAIVGAVGTFEGQQEELGTDCRGDDRTFAVDAITDSASYAITQAHLRETLAAFTEAQVPFGILCLRLEGLDIFRANAGPEAASALLRVVARTLEGALWRTDYVGRWGDDQFLVILNGCNEEGLSLVRERVRCLLFNEGIEWWGERRSLPVSIGQAAAQPGDTIESLVERAQKSVDAASAVRARSAVAGEES